MTVAPSDNYDLIEVDVEPLGQTSRLKEDWKDLESRATASVFLSWFWIETWIEHVSDQLMLIRMVQDDKTIALGLLATSSVPRWLGGKLPAIGLNEVPGSDLSKIAIEYSGLLCEAGVERAVHGRLANFLCTNFGKQDFFPDWRECRLPGCVDNVASAVQQHAKTCRIYRTNAAPYVELSPAFANFETYIKTLGKNTRHQIRRSFRIYQEQGGITLTRPDSISSARGYMERLIELHQSQWVARGKSGAFSSSAFCAFHSQLIDKSFDAGLIDLIEVSAGAQIIGILYNLKYAGVASSYQSGFTYHSDNRLKPGLICHALAVTDYAASHIKTYRFLAGDQRYKQSLSNDSDTLYWIAIQRPDVRMRIENILRALKAKF